MRFFYFYFCLFAPIFVNAQGLTEPQIPFVLNSDADPLINVVDTDDDNDGILDNNDVFPLNPMLSAPSILSSIANATADAGLRRTNPSTNYGADATVQTKNVDRSLIIKFTQPANLDLVSATVTFYGGTENDPVEVYYLPSSTWTESTVTYANNLTNFNSRQLLGTTSAPTAGKYTFTLPLSIFPVTGGAFSLLIYDPNDPVRNIESFFSKETAGKSPSVDFRYNEVIETRVLSDQSTGSTLFLNGSNKLVGFKLSQAPSSVVYVPFELSDTTKAKIIGDKVLVFNASNWNANQNIVIAPLSLGNFDIMVRPLHSLDLFYNGHNPKDLLNYCVQATDITNLSSLSLQTGQTLDVVLNAVSSVGSEKFTFRIIEAPVGLNVVENTGRLSFRPLSNQIGTTTIKIEIVDEFGNVSIFTTTITVTNGNVSDPIGVYVIPNAAVDPLANGSAAHPFNDIETATNMASTIFGGNVFIRGGDYDIDDIIYINTDASGSIPVKIQPLAGEHVKFNCSIRNGFEFTPLSKNIQLLGVELDGGTDNVDFWCVVAQAFWGDLTVPRGGGIAIGVDGEDIVIKNNYIHHFYQKAVEIRGARYLKVYDNIIHSIANSSLSGGHGIMRQQTGAEFFTNDSLSKYRWDINSNLVFNVEQRIYSWVPSKGYIEMVLDEGKPILIDDPKDTNGVQEHMSARITNNVVAYGSIDQIRLKSTPNLTVSNNTVYSAAPNADGITDKKGDTNTPKFVNFNFKNNAIQTQPSTTSIDIVDALDQANTAASPPPVPQTVPATLPPVVSNNYFSGGVSTPASLSGLNNVSISMFLDANNGNFRLNPALGPITNLGVRPTTLDSIDLRKAQFGVEVRWDQFPNDPLKLTQTILDNIPGINDGVAGNESVFPNIGLMREQYSEIFFDVVPGAWKTQTMSKDTQLFHLNERYTEWYAPTNATYKNASGGDYERIRWGNSILKQNQVFDNDWLTVSQITSDTTNTVIYGEHESFTIDGDILIDFENFTPSINDTFDLIKAATITSGDNLFDRVIFEGYTPTNYLLSIVNVPGGQAVRLKILGNCDLTVTNTNDSGNSSLRDAIACALDGDVIILSSAIENDTIKLTSGSIVLNKNISIVSEKKEIYVQNCTGLPITIAAGKEVGLTNFQILSNMIANNGQLTCTDMVFKTKTSTGDVQFLSSATATLQIKNQVRIE
jgi:hypothetical protein